MWHLKDLHSTSHATMAIYYVIHSHLYWVNMFFGPRRVRHHNDDGGSDLQRVEKYGFFHNIWQQNKSHLAVTGEYHVETLVWITVGIPRVAGYQTGAGVTNYPVNLRILLVSDATGYPEPIRESNARFDFNGAREFQQNNYAILYT